MTQHRINTLLDLLKEYSGLQALPKYDALLMAYKFGRSDGAIEAFEQQAISKAKREAEDALMDEAWGNA